MKWFRGENKSGEAAKEALADAQENLRVIRKRGEEVTAVSEALRDIRERNHFAEHMEEILFGRGETT
jgi:hypothetical protein